MASIWTRGRILAWTAAVFVAAQASAATGCDDPLQAGTRAAERRIMKTEDLLSLVEIGANHGSLQDDPVALSPDRRYAAFVARRADAATNGYCQVLVVVAVQPGAPIRVVDRGGQIILSSTAIRGVMATVGAPVVVAPSWSPDGKLLAYLKRVDGVTQAWVAHADGSGAVAVGSTSEDVDRLQWTSDGQTLLIAEWALGPHPTVAEARQGFLYDFRFYPNARAEPAQTTPLAYRYSAYDAATGAGRPLTPREAAEFAQSPDEAVQYAETLLAQNNRLKAWSSVRGSAAAVPLRADLLARTAGGAIVRCPDPACAFAIRRPIGIWVSGETVLFLRRQGWGDSETALFRWTPGRSVQRLLVTDDVLTGCHLTDDTHLLCVHEGSLQPNRLVLVDTQSGSSDTLFDPNPDFSSFALGHVERLHWRNSVGFENYGDLMLPAVYTPGNRLPLVIVQYKTRGFLRGGLGDEYPMQLLAGLGMAVLSVESSPAYFLSMKGRSWPNWQVAERENVRGWANRRSNLSTIMAGIELLVRRGIADPKRVAITGLSDGATTVQFALANYPRFFAAAAVSSGFLEQANVMGYLGTAFADEMYHQGYPRLTRSAPAFWRPLSVRANAQRIQTPVLFNIADNELTTAVESYSALREARVPSELYVYPDEFHIKWQPAHRAIIYDRNLAWLAFWLQNKRLRDLVSAETLQRWDTMRAAFQRRSGPPASRAIKQLSSGGSKPRHRRAA